MARINELERRRIDVGGTELRVIKDAGGAMKKIAGYGAKYNSRSLPMGWFEEFREVIAPGTFDEAISNGSDIRSLFNHDPNFVLGRSASGTLKLSSDSVGLFYEVDPPDTQQARDIMTMIDRGDVSGNSFGFRCLDDDWSEDPNDGTLVRTLKKVSLQDVGPVTYPAYPATDVSLRSLQGVLAQGLERVGKTPAQVEKRLKEYYAGLERRLRLASIGVTSESRDDKRPYGSVDYADPGYQDDGVHRYPIDTVEHIKAAWNYIHKSNDAAKYTADQVKKIKDKIVAAWKEKIDKDGPPGA